MCLNNYHNIQSSLTSTNTSLISILDVENGSQFLNASSVLLLAVTAIFPVNKINASEFSQRLDLILSVSKCIELFWLYLTFAV